MTVESSAETKAMSLRPGRGSALLITTIVIASVVAGLVSLAPRAAAGSWTQSSQQDFLTGDLVNVVATPEGTLQLATAGWTDTGTACCMRPPTMGSTGRNTVS